MGKRQAMDSAAKQERKIALIAQLAAQRQALESSQEGLKKAASASTLLKNSVRQNPISWFTGVLGSTTLLTLLLRRPSSGVKRRGPIRLLIGLGFSLAKPALIKWGTARLKTKFGDYLQR